MLDAILRFLHGHNRFVEDDAEADVIVSESNPSGPPEVCQLANYQFSNFEHERCLAAHGGVTLGFNAMSAAELFDRHFHRVLRHAQRVQIFDGSLGQNCNENYRHTVEAFLMWFRQSNQLGVQCPVELHCRKPADPERLALLGRIGALGIPLTFYTFLPHDRFILTDQFALEIGRGMDFLEPNRGCNRDMSIATKDVRQVGKLMQGYARHQLLGA